MPPFNHTPLASTSISQCVDFFFDHFQFGAPSTQRAYRSGLRAWLEFLRDLDIDPAKAPISSLDRSTVLDFIGWMRRKRKTAPDAEHKKKSSPRFTPLSIKLYTAAILKALEHWRQVDLISFTADAEKSRRKASQTRSKKEDKSYRAGLVPTDYGSRMLQAALSLEVPPDARRTLSGLETLRTRALIALLHSTALRISDTCLLTRQHLAYAETHEGLAVVGTQKSGSKAHVVISPVARHCVQEYLEARADSSAYLLISHGHGGKDSTNFQSRSEYGNSFPIRSARLSVQQVAIAAFGEDNSKYKAFYGPHAFRHWHAQRLRNQHVPVEQIQSILGHASSATTVSIYAQNPDQAGILEAERRLRDTDDLLGKA